MALADSTSSKENIYNVSLVQTSGAAKERSLIAQKRLEKKEVVV